ncbi:MAG TPA: spermidine/putrescine ABC transporter substrate-binding protein, partial [Jatrophihabitantaceae bacterium]|nr:spermidine/putrescine ABC transporter substrate-binding protein [Jatrophihabitantaceae bacterium]
MRISRFTVGVLAVATLAATSLAACSSSKSGGGEKAPKGTQLSTLGNGEGKLNIIVWAGYAEDGTDDPKVDWVHPFEQQTGCKVNAKIGNTSDEMVQLMKSGQYD